MQQFIHFALLGFGVGSLYAITSQGLIVIYRGSGVLNFGLGAIGLVGAYVEYELTTSSGWSFVPALIAGILASAVLGGLVHLLIMRPLKQVSPLVRVVATLGVLITIQSIAILHYTAEPIFVTSELPVHIWTIYGSISITSDRVILLGIAAVLTVALWAFYRYTRFGLGTSAVAENERAAATLGWSPDRIATLNWMLGCGLAGLAAILIVPIVTLQPAVLTDLLLAATATALVASFRSFPIALLAGLVIGVSQTEVSQYFPSQPGISDAVPFVVIVVWMMARGQALPLRDYLLQRLPSIGTGRINWPGLAFAVVVGVVLISFTSVLWIAAFTVSIGVAVILVSIVVITGYTGQLSLAQFAIAGFGAYVAGRLIATQHVSFLVGALIGVVATIPLGILFALPAVRTRGINLAIVTLGLGSSIELVLFDNQNLTGGILGTQVPPPSLFGLNINSAAHPTRYGLFALGCLVVVSLLVANVRRGRIGRRLVAVRTNERAAAALGISVSGAKLYAFGLSAAIAAVGGILVAFTSTSITYPNFTNFTSIQDVALAILGGIGYLAGPVIGGTLAVGGMNQQILQTISGSLGKYVPLIGGISVILIVLLNQNGIARESIAQIAWVRGKLAKRLRVLGPRQPKEVKLPAHETVTRVAESTLEVRGITVRYGGTTAVNDVSLTVKPGQIVGLIGPNGAGKTSLVDAVTGFAKPTAGTLLLDGRDIGRLSPVRRARVGIGRSFQSLELFEDISVFDNLRAASDPRDFRSYLRDLIWPVAPPIPGQVVSAINEFRLGDDLNRPVENLPYGQRRLLAIARAVATGPSILLLDEPAAGLGSLESSELASLVRRLASEWGIGILLVEHDMDFVMSICDELVVLDFGRKIAEGTPDVVRSDPAVIAAYLGEEEPDADGADKRAPAATVHSGETEPAL